MSEKVIELYPQAPIGHFIRLGASPHVLLEEALEAGRLMREGRLTLDRVVVDGYLVPRQRQLLSALSAHGAELILETNVAELSSVGRFMGSVRGSPWAIAGRPLTDSDWRGATGFERISTIARYAVSEGFSRILAPTHLLDRAKPDLRRDIETLGLLRTALDLSGGELIAIDYPLMLPYHAMRDASIRLQIIKALNNLPFDNLWLRISQFGRDASPLGMFRYIDASRDFVSLGKPIVADGVAGFAGLAVVAFGASGAISHGIGVYERFDASAWDKPPKKKRGGGQMARALVSSLDRQLTYREIEMIAAASGGRSLVSCNDVCCKKGIKEMLDDPRTHYIHQRRGALDQLSAEPPTRRADHFVDHILAPADRRARRLSRLSLPDPKLSELLTTQSHRLDRILAMFDNFREHDTDVRRSLPPISHRSLRVREARR